MEEKPKCTNTNCDFNPLLDVGNDSSSVEVTNGGVEKSGEANNNEKSTSGSCVSRLWSRLTSIVPYGGTVSNAFNLASATLGAGIVLLPNAFYSSGIIFALFLLVFCCASTIYTIRLLALTKDKTGFRSYEEMAQGLFGHYVDYFTALLMFVFCFGTCVGYVISVGDLLSPLLVSEDVPKFLKGKLGQGVLVSVIWLVGMLPLSLPKEINSLRYVSVLGVCFIYFFVICMIVHAAQNGLKQHGLSGIQLFNGSRQLINGFSFLVFSFICQVNCFEVYEEMTDPSPAKLAKDSTLSMVFVAVFYFLAGFFGYADFRDAASESVLRLYDPRNDISMAISYVGIAIKLCVGFAICVQPSRDACYYVLRWGKTSDVSTKKNILVSGIIALLALILGLFIPSINTVFGFLGGVCGGFLAFIFPALFHMYAGDWSLKKVGWFNYIFTYLILIIGVTAVVFCTATTIYDEVNK